MNINTLYPKISPTDMIDLIDMARSISGIQSSVLEKDLYLTGLLKRMITDSPYSEEIYFKGGTALAKCHHIIDRFSEDIDLFVYSGDNTGSKKKEDKLNGKVSHLLLDEFPKDILPEGKRGGDYNKILLGYDKSFFNFSFKPHVEFEISSCALRDKSNYKVDSSIHTIQPLIGEILQKAGYEDIVSKLDLGAFKIKCLSPEKALCDKISRMIRVSYDVNPSEQIIKYIRDTYDIAMFLSEEKFKDFLYSKAFLEKMYITNLEDRLRANSHAERSYSEACLFVNPKGILLNPPVKQAYDTMIKTFVFNPEKAPSLTRITSIFESMLPAMQKFDQYRLQMDKGENNTETVGNNDIKPPVNICSVIKEREKETLTQLGISETDIANLETTGHLMIDHHYTQLVHEYDKIIEPPVVNAIMEFSFHDGTVFVLKPKKKKEEIPLRQAILKSEDIAQYSCKKDKKEKKSNNNGIEQHKGKHPKS